MSVVHRFDLWSRSRGDRRRPSLTPVVTSDRVPDLRIALLLWVVYVPRSEGLTHRRAVWVVEEGFVNTLWGNDGTPGCCRTLWSFGSGVLHECVWG